MDKIITDINQLNPNGYYTYADYLMWRFKERVELFKGKYLKMSPAPNVTHQQVSRKIFGNFFSFFEQENTGCELFSAPFDVALLDKKKSTEDKDIHTIVQPDLCIICDDYKLRDGKKCLGAPDLVVEILSPGNSQKEMDIKYDLYQEAGVREYWIVFPTEKMIQIFALIDDKFVGLKPCIVPNPVVSYIFPELSIDLNVIFD